MHVFQKLYLWILTKPFIDMESKAQFWDKVNFKATRRTSYSIDLGLNKTLQSSQ